MDSLAIKESKLRELAHKRQRTTRAGFKNIGDFHNGIYDCDFVSPYTKSANNIEADIMVVLQDWAGSNALSGPIMEDVLALGHSLSLPTNIRLKQLLKKYFDLDLQDTYATNLFPLIKSGATSGGLRSSDLRWAAKEFAIPQIEIIAPKLVICIGVGTFNALRKAHGLKASKNTEEAMFNSFSTNDTLVCCQAHTGRLGQNNRGAKKVEEDWSKMYHEYSKQTSTKL